ncbi:hypothetical protein [Shimia gijangensis]|uniref:hypothetical protein n=1 Tax=Shimia gijangensis TaxID=1470563 RepID=UPI00158816F4|nr:hypothetical protein [Shimia gijangensis]
MFSIAAAGSFVRIAVIRPAEMLQDARMAGLVKLHCSAIVPGERQDWAESANWAGL